ncbi:Diaminopimelate decarboxylase [Diplonema papillatum]|nr:Diaminopimelate decarboxylase [Diplonema papillatum]
MDEFAERSKVVSPVVTAAIEQGLLPSHKEIGPSMDLYDLDALDNRLAELKAAFPEPFFDHAIAVKANPTSGVLSRVVAHGIGLECASLGEVVHSLTLGAKTVIFDSPCKSKGDLEATLLNTDNVYVNLDNENEFEFVEEILKENPGVKFDGRIGLRINPVVGLGAIESVSTAARGSKFGLPLVPETRQRLIDLYKKHNHFLQGVHIHVGSQGCSMDMLQQGATTILHFVKELEQNGVVIKVIDIGGGMPTSYAENSEAHAFAAYRKVLDAAVPDLFSSKYRIMTEFGRCVLTKPGVTVTRIAAVKGAPWHPETPLLVAHIGSNQFVREAYLGDVWRHRFTLLAPGGAAHSGASELALHDIAGPLCFQGDYLGKKHMLPKTVQPNDVLVMHDTGGYTLAMYSKYNSRQAGPVYGYRAVKGKFEFFVLKARETIQETTAFWGPERPCPVSVAKLGGL